MVLRSLNRGGRFGCHQLLADVACWYRHIEERDEFTGEIDGYRFKFAANILQRSYDVLAEPFGISEEQTKCAVIRLEQLSVIQPCSARFLSAGISIPNVLFLGLDVEHR